MARLGHAKKNAWPDICRKMELNTTKFYNTYIQYYANNFNTTSILHHLVQYYIILHVIYQYYTNTTILYFVINLDTTQILHYPNQYFKILQFTFEYYRYYSVISNTTRILPNTTCKYYQILLCHIPTKYYSILQFCEQ